MGWRGWSGRSRQGKRKYFSAQKRWKSGSRKKHGLLEYKRRLTTLLCDKRMAVSHESVGVTGHLERENVYTAEEDTT